MPRATYDANGDIILFARESEVVQEEIALPIKVVQRESREAARTAWNCIQETVKESAPQISVIDIPVVAKTADVVLPAVHVPKKESGPSFFSRLSKQTQALLRHSAKETSSQLSTTMHDAQLELQDAKASLKNYPVRMRGTVRSFWMNANMPVTLPKLYKPGRKPPTKLTLFCIDTVRFGGTFAAIFVVLFVGINYQSFFSIASAELALGGDLKTEQALQKMVNGTPSAGSAYAVQESDAGDVLAYLPPVGPYEDRLVIPKLGANVPIVRPSMAALMKEDWKQFEADIQTALHDGVVHYPGSAKAGQPGNFFLTGHSSYYPWDNGKYKDVFARLGQLVPGDTYSVYYGGDQHTYRVVSKKEVRPNDVSVLDQPTDKRIATLMTCTPIGTTLRRLIVTSEEIDPATGNVLAVGEKSSENQALPATRLESLPI